VDSGLYASLYQGEPDARAKDFLRQFDLAFVFTVREDSALIAAMRGIIPRVKAVITIPPEGTRTHVTEFRLGQLGHELMGRMEAPDVPSLYREQARALLAKAGHDDGRPLVAIHPGSGGKAKCWPLENYLELALRLKREHDPFIFFFTGLAEDRAMKERIDEFVRGQGGAIHLAAKDLGAVAALLGRCSVFVGNDSGITHLAAAMGSPVIALFGPTDPALWGPKGQSVRFIAPASRSLATITVEEVHSAAHEIQNRFTRPYPVQRGH
jgi:ADP-heptose:LPS heptosyltransferase